MKQSIRQLINSNDYTVITDYVTKNKVLIADSETYLPINGKWYHINDENLKSVYQLGVDTVLSPVTQYIGDMLDSYKNDDYGKAIAVKDIEIINILYRD